MSERIWVPLAPLVGGFTSSPLLNRRFRVHEPEPTQEQKLRALLKHLEEVAVSAASEIRMAAHVLAEQEGEEEADQSRELADELSSVVSDTIAAINLFLDKK